MNRRAWLGLLVLLAAGAVWWLTQAPDPGAAIATDAEIETEARAPALTGATEAGVDALEDTTPVADLVHDFTVVDGPDVRLQGRVLLDETPVAAAKVIVRSLAPGRMTWRGREQWVWRGMGGASASLGTALSDAEGGFDLTLPRRSRYEVIVVHAEGRMAPRILWIPAEGDPEPVELRLRVGASLRVRLVGADGQPLANTSVGGITAVGASHVAQFVYPAQTTRTDSRGVAELGSFPAGQVEVQVGPVGSTMHRFKLATPVTGIPVIRVDGGARVNGTVRGPAGQARGGVRVVLHGSGLRGSTCRAQALTSNDGTFSLDGLPHVDVEDVELHVPGSFPRSVVQGTLEAMLPTLRGVDEAKLELVVPAGATLRGRLVAPEGVEMSTGWVQVFDGSAPSLTLEVKADEEGRFELPGLPLGVQTLILHARTANGLKGGLPAPWGGDTLGRWLSRQARPMESLLVEVPMAEVCVLEGHVSGVPAPGHYQVRVDCDARTWVVLGLGHGFVATVPTRGEEARAVLQLHYSRDEATSPPFRLEPGGRVQTTLRLPEQAIKIVRGTVRDANGEPVVGAAIRYLQPVFDVFRGGGPSGPGPVLTHTNMQGQFSLRLEARQVPDESDAVIPWGVMATHPQAGEASSRELSADGEPDTNTLDLVRGAQVRGRVLDASDAPVSGVLVVFTQSVTRRQVTDADGTFLFDAVAAAPYDLVARRGALEAHYRVAELEGHDYPDVDLVLVEPRVLAGRVVSPSGDAIANARVSAVPVKEGKSPFEDEPDAGSRAFLAKVRPGLRDIVKREMQMWGMHRGGTKPATTDRQGRFVIPGVKPGPYVLRVDSGWGTKVGFLPTVSRVTAAPSRDLVITVDEGGTATGRVIGPGGRPVVGADVIGAWVEPDGMSGGMSHNNQRPVARTDGQGRFRLGGLPSDTFSLVVATHAFAVHEEANVRAGSDVTLQLQAGDELVVRILGPDGQGIQGLGLKSALIPAEGKEVPVFGPEAARTLESRVGSASIGTAFAARFSATTDAEGRARFVGLAPGRYRIKQDRSMVSPGQPILPVMDAVAGGSEVTFRSQDSLSIAGRVVDEEGKPIWYHFDFRSKTTPTVDVWQEGRKKATWRGSVAWDLADPQTGKFHVGGLLPGRVKVRVEAGDGYVTHTFETDAGSTGIEIVLKRVEKEEDR